MAKQGKIKKHLYPGAKEELKKGLEPSTPSLRVNISAFYTFSQLPVLYQGNRVKSTLFRFRFV